MSHWIELLYKASNEDWEVVIHVHLTLVSGQYNAWGNAKSSEGRKVNTGHCPHLHQILFRLIEMLLTVDYCGHGFTLGQEEIAPNIGLAPKCDKTLSITFHLQITIQPNMTNSNHRHIGEKYHSVVFKTPSKCVSGRAFLQTSQEAPTSLKDD